MPRQSDLRFTFVPASGVALEVVAFTLTEGLSEPFHLALELSSGDPAVDFGSLLDQPAVLTLWRGEQPVRYVHGIVSTFAQGATGFRRTRYTAVLEPSLARLGLWSDWRVFQQLGVPDILGSMLKARGVIDTHQDIHATHLAREYGVQAGETDLDFLARLSAEEGLAYTFAHRADGHTLMYTDRVQSLGSLAGAPVHYHAPSGGDQAEPGLWRFAYTERVQTATQTQRDYSFKNPRYSQEQRSTGTDMSHQRSDYERYDYPGRYKLDEAGAPFTHTRLSTLRRESRCATVEGDDARLEPGLAFALDGHPREDLNTQWRAVRIVHHGVQHTSQEEDAAGSEQGTRYRQVAELVPATVDWKAPLPPKPRIDGPHIATVVGPPGEEIYCDEYGRIKAQFPWDRLGGNDEHSSCWIRVAQNWAGAAWGHMAIPRIGQEVMVDFLDGDPDQPIVTGRTYHAVNPTPYKLPDFKTLSLIKSKEHKGSRANELRLDDTQAQISAALMSDHGASALHLGYLTQPRPRGGAPRGEGFELRTDASGALRAEKGLLLTSNAQPQAGGGQLSRDELVQGLERALALARNLGDYAAQHQGFPHDASPQQQLSTAVSALSHGANNDATPGDGGQPIIALSSPAGIAAGTPRAITLAAGQHIDSIAQQNQQLTAGQAVLINAGQGMGVFVHGGDLTQIAHQGDLTLQAQKQAIRLQADQSVEISASKEHVLVTAEKHITLMCGGGYIKLEGGNIDVVMPGAFTVKAAKVDFQGPGSAQAALPSFNVGQTLRHFVVTRLDGERPVPNQPYKITLNSGEVIQGVTDAQGATQLLQKDAMHIAQLELPDAHR